MPMGRSFRVDPTRRLSNIVFPCGPQGANPGDFAAAGSSFAPAGRLMSLWRHRDFRLLWAGQTVSELGSQVSLLALPLLAVRVLHATAFEVGVLDRLLDGGLPRRGPARRCLGRPAALPLGV